MAKSRIAKPPKFAEPHTVDIPDEESWSAFVAKPPYTYLRQVKAQYVVAVLLEKLYAEGRRYVRIYIPPTILPNSYLTNPPLFSKTIRDQKESKCFQFVVARYEKVSGRYRITASVNAPQKSGSYLGTCGAECLAEQEKLNAKNTPSDTFQIIFPLIYMPRAYQNNQYVFRHRLQTWLCEQLGRPVTLRLHVSEQGYRIVKIPEKNENFS